MKKKISILGIVLILVLSLVGCGSKTEVETVYDQATMEQQADMILMSFSNMGESDMDAFRNMSDLELGLTLMQSGLQIEMEDFLTMMDAWTAGVKECGDFIERGGYEFETNNEGAILSTPVTCTNRTGTIEFAFDEKMNMESITINADYSLSNQVGVLIQIFINKSLIMPQIQIRFCSIFGHIYFAILIRTHGSRVYVNIWV